MGKFNSQCIYIYAKKIVRGDGLAWEENLELSMAMTNTSIPAQGFEALRTFVVVAAAAATATMMAASWRCWQLRRGVLRCTSMVLLDAMIPLRCDGTGTLNRGVSGGLVCVWPKLKVRREARLDGRLPV